MAYDLKKYQKKLKELEQRKGRARWKPQPGMNVIRICPPIDEDSDFYEEYHVHYINGRPHLCLKFHFDEDCAGCERVDELRASGHKDDEERASDLYARTYYTMNVLVRKDEDKGIQQFDAGKKIFQQLLEYFTDPDWGDLTDPKRGYDVKIKRVGKGRNDTEYTVTVNKNPSSFGDKSLLDEMRNLSEAFSASTYEEMASALDTARESKQKKRKGLTSRRRYEEDDEEEEKRPRRKKHKRPVKKVRRHHEEEEDVDLEDLDIDDDEIDEELEEIEREAKRRKRKSSSARRRRR